MSTTLDGPPVLESTPNEPWALRDLPPFPWITTKVLQLYSGEGDDVHTERLTELIRSDASLASELLRQANSVAFGLRAEVASVERAITMMGLDRVKTLALTLGVGTYVRPALRLSLLRQCWRHSLSSALVAEELAEACEIWPDQAYTAGLLHDVGRLALLVKYPQSYADLLSVVMENQLELLQSERDLFDLDHCEAGVWLAEEWDFPKPLLKVIGEHHRVAGAESEPLTELVHLSCRLADAFGCCVVNTDESEEPQAIFAELPKPVQLSDEDITDLKTRILTRVNSLE